MGMAKVRQQYGVPEPQFPRPPYLFEEFATGPPLRLVTSSKRTALDNRQFRFIIWARAQRVSPRVTAELLGVHPRTVQRFLVRVRTDPGLIVEYGIVERVRLGRERRFVCRFCGFTLKDEESAGDHGFIHIWGEDLLDTPPNERGRYLLLQRGRRGQR